MDLLFGLISCAVDTSLSLADRFIALLANATALIFMDVASALKGSLIESLVTISFTDISDRFDCVPEASGDGIANPFREGEGDDTTPVTGRAISITMKHKRKY